MTPEPKPLGQPTFAVCTGHPQCEGVSLIPDHDDHCPFDGGDDCDNETCFRGCRYCTTEGGLN